MLVLPCLGHTIKLLVRQAPLTGAQDLAQALLFSFGATAVPLVLASQAAVPDTDSCCCTRSCAICTNQVTPDTAFLGSESIGYDARTVGLCVSLQE